MNTTSRVTGAVADVPMSRGFLRRRILWAMLCYFASALAMGWLLAPIRDYFIRAGYEPLMAVFWQAIATLLLLIWMAGWVVQTFDVPLRAGPRLAVGAGAMVLLLACDLLVGYLALGLSPWAIASHFANPEGGVVGVGLFIGALLPLLRGRR